MCLPLFIGQWKWELESRRLADQASAPRTPTAEKEQCMTLDEGLLSGRIPFNLGEPSTEAGRLLERERGAS